MGEYIETNKYTVSTNELCKRMGISRMTLFRWEKMGKFTAPRTIGGYRKFTRTQVRHIIKAFQPGGNGYWHFKPGDTAYQYQHRKINN